MKIIFLNGLLYIVIERQTKNILEGFSWYKKRIYFLFAQNIEVLSCIQHKISYNKSTQIEKYKSLQLLNPLFPMPYAIYIISFSENPMSILFITVQLYSKKNEIDTFDTFKAPLSLS